MTIKVYISGISGSQDVRKTQQRVLFILSTLPIDLEIIDITEPGREKDRAFMQEEVRKHNKKDVLPPQIFNDEQYCGNYEDFQLAADDDVLMSFLKLEEPPTKSDALSNGHQEQPAITQNGVTGDERESVPEDIEQASVNEVKENEALEQTGEEAVNLSEPTESVDVPNEPTTEEAGLSEPAESVDAPNEPTTEEASMDITQNEEEKVEEPSKKAEEEEEEEEESEEEESD